MTVWLWFGRIIRYQQDESLHWNENEHENENEYDETNQATPVRPAAARNASSNSSVCASVIRRLGLTTTVCRAT
jgi:hypothetical protein